jgi:hypothetical protein
MKKVMLKFIRKNTHLKIAKKILKVLSNAGERGVPDAKMCPESWPSKLGAHEGRA